MSPPEEGQANLHCTMTDKKPESVPDRRVRRTRSRLRAALHSLIQEKSYDSIVVKQILRRADVGRSTFYAHFNNKDHLLESVIREMVDEGAAPQGVLRFSAPIFQRVHDHRIRKTTVMSGATYPTLHWHLEKVLLDRIRPLLSEAQGGVPGDLLARHVVSTFMMVLTWWAESESPLPPEAIDDLFRRLIAPTLPPRPAA